MPSGSSNGTGRRTCTRIVSSSTTSSSSSSSSSNGLSSSQPRWELEFIILVVVANDSCSCDWTTRGQQLRVVSVVVVKERGAHTAKDDGCAWVRLCSKEDGSSLCVQPPMSTKLQTSRREILWHTTMLLLAFHLDISLFCAPSCPDTCPEPAFSASIHPLFCSRMMLSSKPPQYQKMYIRTGSSAGFLTIVDQAYPTVSCCSSILRIASTQQHHPGRVPFPPGHGSVYTFTSPL